MLDMLTQVVTMQSYWYITISVLSRDHGMCHTAALTAIYVNEPPLIHYTSNLHSIFADQLQTSVRLIANSECRHVHVKLNFCRHGVCWCTNSKLPAKFILYITLLKSFSFIEIPKLNLYGWWLFNCRNISWNGLKLSAF